jgi:hypothetical protein
MGVYQFLDYAKKAGLELAFLSMKKIAEKAKEN